MSADIGDFAKGVLDGVLQKNTFECVPCGHQITYMDGKNLMPLFPCDKCGKVDWFVFSINDTKIWND